MTEPPSQYGNPARGVVLKDVAHAADELLRLGDRPTVEKIRAKIGSGSPNTVGPLLDTWWKSLALRLDAGPAAFHRLPESVSHIAEALWLQALDEARARAVLEQTADRRVVTQDKDRVEARSHVLSLREAELESRLKEKDKLLANMDARLGLLASALTREQTGRNQLIRKLNELESKAALPVATRAVPRKQRSKADRRRTPIKSKQTPAKRRKHRR